MSTSENDEAARKCSIITTGRDDPPKCRQAKQDFRRCTAIQGQREGRCPYRRHPGRRIQPDRRLRRLTGNPINGTELDKIASIASSSSSWDLIPMLASGRHTPVTNTYPRTIIAHVSISPLFISDSAHAHRQPPIAHASSQSSGCGMQKRRVVRASHHML
ncbi:hypothetical protein V495_04039 [Pseudogymnoascus sp. VKM F-4514 (FW-929)]|nr:hypothetical protein V495_04039 [Pseudogymnoascus sp. VKM F-4514 (FW-929)]